MLTLIDFGCVFPLILAFVLSAALTRWKPATIRHYRFAGYGHLSVPLYNHPTSDLFRGFSGLQLLFLEFSQRLRAVLVR